MGVAYIFDGVTNAIWSSLRVHTLLLEVIVILE